MRLPFRSTRFLALAVVTAAVPFASLAGGGRPATATVAQVVTVAPEIPDSPAGRQLRWFLDAPSRAPLTESELGEHVNSAYLRSLTVDGFNAFLKNVTGFQLEELTTVTPTALVGTGTIGGEKFVVQIHVDAEGKIDLIGMTLPTPPPPPSPTSWKQLDARLRQAAPQVGFLAAEIDSRGRCETVHAVNPDRAQPLGSIFKLYVMGAVAEKIRDGRLSWNTKLTIRPEWRSTGEGGLADRPDNSTVTVREAAKLMISISDNTATDLLIHTVGRGAVESTVRRWSGHAKQNVPFLTTRELFLLKGVNYPAQANAYLALRPAEKAAYLKNTVAKQALTDIKPWDRPREIDRLEWFGSPRDVCRAYAGLTALNSKPLHEAMSANDLGLKLDPRKWPVVWAKGGSELGVLDLSFRARSSKGKTYVVTALTNNPQSAIDERTATGELISLSRGAFTLATSG
ncbi:serine hydrolase [Streptosporangium subroseum]|uniref:serine hydrolase n=1 Tax=Streptosporangium subroseum TaxID=106412 RepID=UPI0030932B00|nr:serine hydrolase [Streptosporangium subroseum]